MTANSNNPQITTPARADRSKSLRGNITVPGDKSISHRALMLSSQALGTTEINGLLEGEDVIATANALRQCSVSIVRDDAGVWTVTGVGIGGLSEPDDVLDMGNAGTAARLMMGLLAPYPYHVLFTGDASLRKRPMQRVITPLEMIGAHFWTREGGRLPLAMHGAAMPLPIEYTLPVASAQVKSAIMLAALNTPGTTTVIEHEATRDHTERMLRFFGVNVDVRRDANGTTAITVHGQPQQLFKNRQFQVPADPSSAAFPLVAALLVPNSSVTITNVCLNPARIGLIDTLKEMGADISISNERDVAGEPVGDITAKNSNLQAVTVPAHRAPSMIDEYPILAIAAACAHGKTIMRGVSELRVKESNRLAAIIAGLHACGVEAMEEGDDLIVFGRGKAPRGGGTVITHFDHRIAMSFLVLGLVSEKPVTVDDTRAIATSFPGFMELMRGLGAEISVLARSDSDAAIHLQTNGLPWRPKSRLAMTAETHASNRRLVIAVDGPAASGKGTLARRLANHFGTEYLDTGSLYRAVGMRVLYADQDPKNVAAAIAAARAIQPQDMANPKLRGERIGQAASIVSAYPEVRQALLEYQHAFAANPRGAVLDGRDIGTVICPDADVKFFITASLEARAKRRHRELQDYGVTVDYQSVYDDLVERDERDATRATAPMLPAEDALIVDTSEMSMNDVFTLALQLIANRG
jgi:3-phosphoshikimate 1-carboxyvinyltransferase